MRKRSCASCKHRSGRNKSATVNNKNSPVWEFKVELDYMEASPRQASIEVFDDDIGKDAPIGNVTLDINEVVKASKIEQTYKLANCKTGELMISAFFSPTDTNVVTEDASFLLPGANIVVGPPLTEACLQATRGGTRS